MNTFWRRLYIPIVQLRALKTGAVQRTLTTTAYKSPRLFNTTYLCNCYSYTPIYTTLRHKSKRKAQDSDDEDDPVIVDDDTSLSKDSKLVKLNVTSLRTDLILKSSLGIARNKIEQLFYESKIRINGRKILKKSTTIRVGDEIDVIKMISPKNSDHIYVYRVEIQGLTAKEDSINVTARRFKNLLIENYETDPYKGSSAESE